MATKKVEETVVDSKIPESVRAGIEALAKGLGVAAVELWTIFVRQYVVKGIAELFTALVLIAASLFLFQYIGLFSLIGFAVALVFCYGTIPLLGNPRYYAITDITNRIKEIK